MYLRKIVLSLGIVASVGAIAQKSIPVQKYLMAGPFALNKPVVSDSINVKGEKYNYRMMLKTAVTPAKTKGNYHEIVCDSSGLFRLNKPASDNSFTLFRFYVTPDRYASVKINVQSTSRFEVYVDGDKGGEKTTNDESLDKSLPELVSFKADPRRYEVVIKLFCAADDKCSPVLQAEVLPAKSDTVTHFSVTDNPSRKLFILDFMEGKRPKSVSISPNGRFALIKYSTAFKNGTTVALAQVIDVNTGKVLLTDNNNSRSMNWMPKSNKLYYADKNANGRTLWMVDPVTQEEKVLAEQLVDGAFDWSPDEKYLIFKLEDIATDEMGDLKRLLSPEDRQPDWRKRTYLSRYDLSSGLLSRLTFGKNTTELQDISPDARRILYKVTRDIVTERPFKSSSLYELNLETMVVDTLWKDDKFAESATYSPDGKKIAITGAAESFGGIGLNIKPGQISNLFDIQLYIMDLASKKIEPVSRAFNPSISSLAWSKTDGKIYMKTVDEDYVRVYSYDVQKKLYKVLPLTPDVITGIDLATSADRVVYYGQNLNSAGAVYVYDLKAQQERLLADPAADRLRDVVVGKVEDWNFRSSDGTLIKGRCYLPPAFDPKAKYPMIVYYYGGTTPSDRSFERNYPYPLYAAMGYVVYTLQPSGSIGFGQEFSARHVNAWGDKTADEIIEGTKLFCRQHAFVDSTRVGCLGASYGGFMTMYLQTKTDIFAAAVSHAGISSIASYWGEGYWGYTYSAAAAAESYPWNNPALYTDHSPLFHADKVKTPILLLHGTADTNVPIGESIQMYTALKVLGKPVEFVRVDGENHQITNLEKKFEWQRTILAWFDRYLKKDSRWWNDLYKASPIEK